MEYKDKLVSETMLAALESRVLTTADKMIIFKTMAPKCVLKKVSIKLFELLHPVLKNNLQCLYSYDLIKYISEIDNLNKDIVTDRLYTIEEILDVAKHDRTIPSRVNGYIVNVAYYLYRSKYNTFFTERDHRVKEDLVSSFHNADMAFTDICEHSFIYRGVDNFNTLNKDEIINLCILTTKEICND